MPRYYFDLQDHENVADLEGTELASDDTARVQAVMFAGQYLKDHPELIWDGHEIRVHVLTERRTPLFLVVVLGIGLAQRPGFA